jgi:hypothetical protein
MGYIILVFKRTNRSRLRARMCQATIPIGDAMQQCNATIPIGDVMQQCNATIPIGDVMQQCNATIPIGDVMPLLGFERVRSSR